MEGCFIPALIFVLLIFFFDTIKICFFIQKCVKHNSNGIKVAIFAKSSQKSPIGMGLRHQTSMVLKFTQPPRICMIRWFALVYSARTPLRYFCDEKVSTSDTRALLPPPFSKILVALACRVCQTLL